MSWGGSPIKIDSVGIKSASCLSGCSSWLWSDSLADRTGTFSREVRHRHKAGGLMSGAASKVVKCLCCPRAEARVGHLSAAPIRCFLLANVLADLLQLELDRGHYVTAGREILPREFSLHAAPSNSGVSAHPFEKPDHRSHRVLGGIAMLIGTWSGIRCPSKIWHLFCRAKAWKISPECRRVFPHSILRRRLGTNTTWCLKSHLGWDRL